MRVWRFTSIFVIANSSKGLGLLKRPSFVEIGMGLLGGVVRSLKLWVAVAFFIGGHVFAMPTAMARDAASAVVLKLLEEGAGAIKRSLEQGASTGATPADEDSGVGPVGFANCPHLFPGGKPLDTGRFDKKWEIVELCSNHFAVVYSKLAKAPLLVVEKLNRDLLADAKGESRTDVFYADPRLKRGERAELSDFVGSKRDRGHLASAANQPNRGSMVQSFALSNVVLQDPTSNQEGAWLKAEKDTRKYVRRAKGDVWAFSGPQFKGEVRKVGKNRVWEPTHLFKMIYDGTEKRSWALVIENTAEATLNRPLSYEQFVAETGMDVLEKTDVKR